MRTYSVEKEKGEGAHINLTLVGAMTAAAVQSLKVVFEMKQV